MISVTMEIMSGAMRGFGYSLPPALVTLFGICCVRIVWIFTVFEMHPTYSVLMAVYGISWAITAVLLYIVYVRFVHKLKKQEHSLN